MRHFVAVLFWVGLFWAIREWFRARRRGLAITRAEKLYLVLIFPIFFAVQLALDSIGVALEIATAVSMAALGLALTAWALRRRVLGSHTK